MMKPGDTKDSGPADSDKQRSYSHVNPTQSPVITTRESEAANRQRRARFLIVRGLGICLLVGSVYLLFALGIDTPGAAKLRYGAVVAGLLGAWVAWRPDDVS